jgi:ornithine carbamoyltransferase
MDMRHFLHVFDLTPDEITHLLDEATRLKADLQRGRREPRLLGWVLGLVFEKPSLRTRGSFEAAMAQLGGASIFLPSSEVGFGSRESVPDFARAMSQYVDAVVLRTFRHQTVEAFAAHSVCPVINGLSDQAHPCQALADLLTLREVFGDVAGRTVAFVGDGNNVARSLAVGCGKLGARFVLAAPKDYLFDEEFLQTLRREAPHGELVLTSDPVQAVREADVIYTDVWTSMGQEAERAVRLQHFKDYQLNAALLAKAPASARVMHCLPAHRGEEITDEVLDGERSLVFRQAGNRLHVQKALLLWLLS